MTAGDETQPDETQPDETQPGAPGNARGPAVLLTETVAEILARQARDNADGRAVIWEAEPGKLDWFTYSQLAARANAVAHTLAGLPAGQRVAVWGRNCVDWVLVEYACALRGLILVAINTAWTDAEVTAALELAEPAVLFAGTDSRGAPVAERARRLAAATGGQSPEVRDLGGLLTLPDAPPATVPVGPDTPLLIQFTSGTTGRAKGAVLTHRGMLNAAYLRQLRSPASSGVGLNSVPFHHVGGSVSIILGALTSGGAFIVVDKFDPVQTVRLLALAGVTNTGGVPIMVERVLDQPGVRAAARGVITVGLGGADISPQLVRRVRDELGAAVMTTYAQSECPVISNSEPGDSPDQVARTAGRPVEETEVRILDPVTGIEVATGETGEIAVRSPVVMAGYFRMPERTAEVLPGDGFLRTGDLGSVDADGYLTVRGRIREVIIRGGENIYPAEVEAALAEHPAVLNSAVVGIADPSWGEIVGASVQLRPGPASPVQASPGPVSAADLEAFLAARLAHFKIPRVWRFVDGFPMTASGKIRRVIVKEEMSKPMRLPGA
jgi:acyl-CoA synthetase (AMP-forming)/AMP-acid ligase II